MAQYINLDISVLNNLYEVDVNRFIYLCFFCMITLIHYCFMYIVCVIYMRHVWTLRLLYTKSIKLSNQFVCCVCVCCKSGLGEINDR